MEAKIYTYSDITAMLKEIVEEAGADFVYERKNLNTGGTNGCYYAKDGKADCIVGHVLERIGAMDPEECSPKHDGVNYVIPQRREVGFGLELTANHLWNDLKVMGFRLDKHAQDLLEIVQFRQDIGWTWGAALTAAISIMNDRIERRL